MELIFAVFLTIVVALLASSALRKARGNYLLSIFLFLFSFVSLYGYALYKASPTITLVHGRDVLPLCWLVVLVGLGGVALGYTSVNRRAILGWPHLRRPPDDNRLGIWGLTLIFLAWLGEAYFIGRSGGVEAYFSRARGAGAVKDVTAYIYGARWLMVPGIAFLVGAGMGRRFWRIPAVVAFTVFLGYNLVLGQRTGIFLSALMALFTYAYWRRRLPRPHIIVAAIAASAIFMGFVKLTRGDYYIGTDFSNVNRVLTAPTDKAMQEMILANVGEPGGSFTEGSEIVVFAGFLRAIPELVDFDYFNFYSSFLYVWIPRVVWPGRPDVTEKKVLELEAAVGTSYKSGTTPTLLGMYYLHLGFISVFLLSAFTGWYLGVIDAHGQLGFSQPAAAAAFILFAPPVLSMPIGLGPLSGLPVLLPFQLVPLLVGLTWACWPSSRSKRRQWGVLVPRATEGDRRGSEVR